MSEKTREQIVAHFVHVLSLKYHRKMGGLVELEEIQGMARVGGALALRDFKEVGRFDGYAAKRIKWSIGDGLRTLGFRSRNHLVREAALCVSAAEQAANAFEGDPLEPVDGTDAETVARAGMAFFRMNLSRAEEADDVPDSSVNVERDADRSTVREAVAALPEKLRTVVTAVYFEELTVEEISATTGIPRTTLYNRLKQGVEELSRLIGPRPD